MDSQEKRGAKIGGNLTAHEYSTDLALVEAEEESRANVVCGRGHLLVAEEKLERREARAARGSASHVYR